MQLDQTSDNFPYFNTLAPWILVHNILSIYEATQSSNDEAATKLQGDMFDKNTDKSSSDNDEDENGEKSSLKTVSPAPSTLLLITAHEELGKNSWCSVGGGILLLRMLDTFLKELLKSLSEKQRLLLHQSVEQIVFCLFGHPSKKTKASFVLSKHKHLRDHGVQPISLTWDIAVKLYKYFAPSDLPEFESSQISSISDDISVLFKRIVSVLPSEFIYTNQIESINAYLSGEKSEVVQKKLSFPSEIRDIYYLLADYYFKSKEWYWAIFYYKLDVTINPNRLDAWAPMGLAKKAQLETQLNSCDIISDEEKFFREAYMAARCLRKALQLETDHCNLWVEKGGLVYMIFSHASRLLKQDLNPDVSIERFEYLEKVKEEMMQEARTCFEHAVQIDTEGVNDDSAQDERWLYQYMLGKLAEKSFKSPDEIIDHYMKAADFLKNALAKYPVKINYSNPQEYAVEVLEIYYRIYTFIFKYLYQREGKCLEPAMLKLLTATADKVDQFPFVKGNDQKIQEALKKRPLTDDDQADSSKIQKTDFIEKIVSQLINSVVEICTKKKDNSKSIIDDEIEVIEEHVEKKAISDLIKRCINAWQLCITRFPHHYKSIYRLAYYYHNSKFHKKNEWARNYLFGSEHWQKHEYMPTNGLFCDRKIFLPNVRNCNLFHGVWRIPHDEIDRPGSFAAHMHRSLSLCLDVLQQTKDFYSILEIALSLKYSPDKDKKYLRDNERELLSTHAMQVGIQLMKDKSKLLFKGESSTDSERQSYLFEVHKVYKHLSRHFASIEPATSKILVESYAAMRKISTDNFSAILKEVESYCSRNSSLKRKSSPSPSYTPNPTNASKKPRALIPIPIPIKTVSTSSTSNQSVAVQQAYKVYESLIKLQPLINSRDTKLANSYKKKYDDYKQQMLKYLQIPSVSKYFNASLKNLTSSASKLPPPSSVVNCSKVKEKSGLSVLAARSQVHGISISSVTKNTEMVTVKPVAPNMSISLSPSKHSKPVVVNCSSIKTKSAMISFPTIEDKPPKPISCSSSLPLGVQTISVKKTSLKDSDAISQNKGNSLPKLPSGTTLIRHADPTSQSTKSNVTESSKPIPVVPTARPLPIIHPRSSVSITPKDKKMVSSSFQDAFQAAIAKGKLPFLSGKQSNTSSTSEKSDKLTKPSLKTTKQIDPIEFSKKYDDDDVITLD